MKLTELAAPVTPSADAEITGLSLDSRETRPGDLFCAVPGVHTDGTLFIAEAIKKGCAAVVAVKEPAAKLPVPVIVTEDIAAFMADCADRFFRSPSARLHMTGITGTNGKTTTSYLLESIFSSAGRTCGLLGTINYRSAGKILCDAPNTTPHAIKLQSLLTKMVSDGCRNAVMEVSSHSLAYQRVRNINFDTAVFMNLSREHLDFHKTMDDYFLAKRRLFDMLASSSKTVKTAVICHDDPYGRKLEEHIGKTAGVITFGTDGMFSAHDIRPALDGVSFTLGAPDGEHKVNLNLWGAYNVQNALAAIAAARAAGVSTEDAVRGCELLACVPGRMQKIDLGQNFHVYVDFAHTEKALANVLANLAGFPHRKIYTIFGCGGERDRGKRGPMACAVCAASDHAFMTMDNPRGEPLAQIFDDMTAGAKAAGFSNFTVIPDRAEAIRRAVKAAQEGDIVLLAGKGHEETMIEDRVYPFSDRAKAERAIKDLKL